MIEIKFTPEERAAVIHEAQRRRAADAGLMGRNGEGFKGDMILDYLGAAGEMAVAIYLDMKQHVFAEQRAVRGSCDLPGIDVKARSRENGRLIVQGDETVEKDFFLVTIFDKRIVIRGWLPLRECRRPEYWADPVGGRPAFFIPQDHLYSPRTWRFGF